jgi:hypothetical protein
LVIEAGPTPTAHHPSLVLDILGPVFSCCSLQEHQVWEDVESIDPEHGQNWPCHLLNVPQQVHLHAMWGRTVWVAPFAVTSTAFPMLGGNFPQPSVAQQMYTGLLVISTANFGQPFCFKELAAWSPVVDKSNTLFTAWKKLE